VDFFAGFTKNDLNELRDKLIALRQGCLVPELDHDGAIILSHAIRWLYFKIAGEPYREMD
jgi:hypothetical protein